MIKRIIVSISLSLLATIAFANCDPDNANNTKSGRISYGTYVFIFARTCDEIDHSCSRDAKLILTEDGKESIHPMQWGTITENWSFMYSEKKAKNVFYKVQYTDLARDSGRICMTQEKPLSDYPE